MNTSERLLQVASKYIGTKEEGGDNKGAQVEEFQKAVDDKALCESWCMAFVQFCIKQVEKLTGEESRLASSEHCLTVWNGTPKDLRVSSPEPGCVVIWRHGDSTSGHTGIVVSVSPDSFVTIEGNTGPGAGVVREGDGVYQKTRTLAGSEQMKIVGFLMPFKARG